ncbi:hypothetical protein AS149_08210 [Burkholderia cenocepacia]|nr:hypothetical protein AS149_08210 [Burkholderia cenocepacia]
MTGDPPAPDTHERCTKASGESPVRDRRPSRVDRPVCIDIGDVRLGHRRDPSGAADCRPMRFFRR